LKKEEGTLGGVVQHGSHTYIKHNINKIINKKCFLTQIVIVLNIVRTIHLIIIFKNLKMILLVIDSIDSHIQEHNKLGNIEI